jgi:hypothetical protein
MKTPFRRRREAPPPGWDPGRELQAERRARELLRSVVSEEDYAMYRELGFLRVIPRSKNGTEARYGYLLYPHRPLVAYSIEEGELLGEYCVGFPERGIDRRRGAGRLPDADDVCAKWLALHGDERAVINDSNLDLPGRQFDPAKVRRDLRLMRHWESRRRRERWAA